LLRELRKILIAKAFLHLFNPWIPVVVTAILLHLTLPAVGLTTVYFSMTLMLFTPRDAVNYNNY